MKSSIILNKYRLFGIFGINAGFYLLSYCFVYFSHLLIQPNETYQQGGKLVEIYTPEYYISFENFQIWFMVLLFANLLISGYLAYKRNELLHSIFSTVFFIACLMILTIISIL